MEKPSSQMAAKYPMTHENMPKVRRLTTEAGKSDEGSILFSPLLSPSPVPAIHDHLDNRQSEHGYSGGPWEEAGPEIKLPALPECNTEDKDNEKGRRLFLRAAPSEAPLCGR